MNNETKKNSNFKWIIILAIVFLAAITNPDKEDFKNYLSNELNEEVSSGDWLSSFLGDSVIDLIVDGSVTKKDYVVISIYELEFEGETASYIGIFNNFVQLD